MDMQLLRQLSTSTTDQYHEDIINMIETWFEKVRDIANNEGISDVKTETFIDVKSVIGSIIDYASRKDIESNRHWNEGKNWTK